SGNRQRAALGILLLLFGAALVTDHVVAAWALRCRVPVLDLVVGILNPIGSGITLLIACAALAVLARRLRRLWLQDAAWLAALAAVWPRCRPRAWPRRPRASLSVRHHRRGSSRIDGRRAPLSLPADRARQDDPGASGRPFRLIRRSAGALQHADASGGTLQLD